MGASAISCLLLVATLAPLAFTRNVPQGAIAVPLVRADNLSYYVAEFQVGTPPQKEFLTMDTGSATVSFLNPRNPWCATATKPCSRYGTFDNTSSSTSIYAGPGFSDTLADFGGGDFLNDTVAVGGVSVQQMYFGYLNRYAFAPAQVSNPTETVAGLAINCQAAAISSCKLAGPYLLPQLKNASAIYHMAVSFYLGPENANNTGSTMILGGAYDKAKMAGKPITLKMTDSARGQTNNVNVTTLSVVTGGKVIRETFGDADVGQPVLMDTGNANWFLPYTIYNPIFAAFGSPTQLDPRTGGVSVSCAHRSLNASSNYVNVSFAGSDGQIKVPLSTLVVEFGDGTCSTFVRNSSTPVLSAFGAPFLRSTYAVFDAQNFELTFAQAKYTTKTKYRKLPQAGFGR